MSDYRKDTNKKKIKERNKTIILISVWEERVKITLLFYYLDKAFCCCNNRMYKIAYMFILEQNTS